MDTKKNQRPNHSKKSFLMGVGRSYYYNIDLSCDLVVYLDALEFLGWIATDRDYLATEFDTAVSLLKKEDGQRTIFTLHKPEHPFSKHIEKLKDKLFLK